MSDERSLESVKLHRRRYPLDGPVFTLLSVRSTEPERFEVTSSVDASGTTSWDIVATAGGNRLLGVLGWALAFQTNEPAVVVIAHPLVTSSAHGLAGAPIILVNTALGAPSAAGLAELVAFLALPTEDQGQVNTVKLSTRSLTRALADRSAFDAAQEELGVKRGAHRTRQWIDVISGVVVLGASPDVLKSIAVDRATPAPAPGAG